MLIAGAAAVAAAGLGPMAWWLRKSRSAGATRTQDCAAPGTPPAGPAVQQTVPAPHERAFLGHTGPVVHVAYSRDGRKGLSAGLSGKRDAHDPSIRLWDLGTGEQLMQLDGHTATATPAFLADGLRCVSAGNDGTFRLWDLATGKQAALLGSDLGEVWDVAVSPNGRSAVTGGLDRLVHHWDLERAVETGQFTGCGGTVASVRFSPDGTQLLSACTDGVVRLWDVATRQLAESFRGHFASPHCVALSPDARRMLSSEWGKTGQIILWDARDRGNPPPPLGPRRLDLGPELPAGRPARADAPARTGSPGSGTWKPAPRWPAPPSPRGSTDWPCRRTGRSF